MLNTSATATPATRLRLTYRINAGALSGQSGANRVAEAINEQLRGEPFPAFLVSPATQPVQGGTAGNGALGVLTLITGRYEYFTSVDVVTDYALATMTWGQLLQHAQAIQLGLLGLDMSCELHDAVVISRESLVATSPTSQQSAATGAARTSAAGSAPNQLASVLSKTGVVVLVVALLAGGAYWYTKRA